MTLKLGLYIVAALFIAALFGKTYQAGKEHERAKLTAVWQAKYDEAVKAKDAAEAHDRQTTANHEREILSERERHAQEISDARAVIQPVRLCKPASRSAVPAVAGPTDSPDSSAGHGDVPLQVSEDIGPALIVFAEACQRDRDDALAWQKWYAEIRR